jgi:hypothetical protein
MTLRSVLTEEMIAVVLKLGANHRSALMAIKVCQLRWSMGRVQLQVTPIVRLLGALVATLQLKLQQVYLTVTSVVVRSLGVVQLLVWMALASAGHSLAMDPMYRLMHMAME